VSLYDEDRAALRIGATYGLPADYRQRAQAVPYQDDGRDIAPVIVVPDLQNAKGNAHAALHAELDLRTLVVATMTRGDELLGELSIYTLGETRQFEEEELALLRGLADQATQAITNARLFKHAQERLRRLAALNTIDRAITARYQLVDTLDVVLEQVTTQLGVDAAEILLLEKEQGVLAFAAGRGFRGQSRQGIRLPLGDGLGDRVLLERRTLTIPEFGLAEGFVPPSLINDERFVSYCGGPLMAEGEVQGVLNVYNRTALAFEEEWIGFFEALSLQAAIVIDNSRLFSETQRLYAETLDLLEKTQTQARQVQQIVDTMPEGVLLLNARRQVMIANRLGQDYLAMLAGAAVGDIVDEFGGRPLEALLQAAPGGRPWFGLTVPQAEQYFEIAVQTIDHGARDSGWVMLLRDVTEERKRQEYLQTQDRLATVGTLATGIAHDFNNIMAVISLYGQALTLKPDHPSRAKYLQEITRQARHASALIAQILDFSRASKLERSHLDLTTYVKELVKLLRRTLSENIVITMDTGDGSYAVEADPTRLQQVLMNLAVNARDAMPDGGKLHIALSPMKIGPEQPPPLPDLLAGEYVRLSVSDTGEGIPAEVLPRVFEPFYTTKPRGKGTGLGLAQVYGIVKQHGGAVGVRSRPGETTFTIYLPMAAEQYAN
jgi:signal transduction histidine kinase